jgi:hypothetical protein
MTRLTGGGRTATAMGHLPITESLPRLAGVRAVYTHLNNTNPAADPAWRGAEIATDRQAFDL